ncbi:hypothetical protein BCIN_08g04960 [Botrytis cinerea B05.10]|uniref:Uncharacterized protein n=1 Tax=Botryotinia fuckeliana (strain B05.10) TaxID=332648 RepID=A0A384JR62_BOTFB|nr:hypothetical protein BCIN_08g04960 [Botrytis cinerea B05.10]ATZ52877.1 hypothetical protein BCIN_08g04960 [Botrytis cinerea B05.10]
MGLKESQNSRVLTSEIYNHGPVHQRGSEIIAFICWKAENWHHNKDKRRGGHSNWLAEFAKMPWSTSKSIANKEYANKNRDGESNIGCNGANGEDCANSYASAKDQQQEEATYHSIEPYGIDWSISRLIDSLDPPRTWKAIVAGIGESYSRSGHHTSLTHKKSAHNSEGKNSERDLLWHHLDEIRCPWLSKWGINDLGDIDDSVSNNKLQSPSHKTSNSTGQNDRARSCDTGITALFRKMERGIISRHCPNNGDKRHKDCDSIWPIGTILNRPDLLRRKEFWRCGSSGD